MIAVGYRIAETARLAISCRITDLEYGLLHYGRANEDLAPRWKASKRTTHYVPQAYLRQWTINGKILTYRLLVPHEKCEPWKPQSPKSIAKHQHLYTYFSGSKDSDEIERWLDRDFEEPAFASIAKVVSESRLTSEDWNNLFRFAVAQSVRTPAGLQRFMKRQDETLGAVLSESMKDRLPKLEQLWLPV